MQIINRYISYTIISNMLVVLFILLSLFTFFSFLDQIDDIGRGNYGVLNAIYYVLLTTPTLIHQLFPMTALMGVTIGLGMLSSNSELIAIRSVGVSMKQIVFAVMKVGAVLMVMSTIIGEWVAPNTEQHAQMIRSVAISEQLSLEGDQGLWARDGDAMINIRSVLPSGKLGDIYIYTFSKHQGLLKLEHAKSAVYHDNRWKLQELSTTLFFDNRTQTKFSREATWNTNVSPDLLSVVTIDATAQSTFDLYQYINYLESNRVTADSYKQAFWSKISVPLVTGVMVLLAIPFVFGPLRSVGIGHRILVAVLVGVGFHLINQTFSYIGLVFGFNAAVSALLPTSIAFVVAIILLRRVN